MPEKEFRLSGIRQVSITVQDLKKAVTFYRDSLGIPFLFETPSLAFFDCIGIRLMLALPEKPEDNLLAWVVYLNVADINGFTDALSKRGVRFVDKPHIVGSMNDVDVWMNFFSRS
jgi:catechol 2,3-dioxygenase-like lactoylglutathione lyase family enzyme